MGNPETTRQPLELHSFYGDEPKHVVGHMEHCRSADLQCEEEGLRCNPSSSDVFIAAEGRGEGLGVWGASLSTPRGDITHTTNIHMTGCDQDAIKSNPSELS